MSSFTHLLHSLGRVLLIHLLIHFLTYTLITNPDARIGILDPIISIVFSQGVVGGRAKLGARPRRTPTV